MHCRAMHRKLSKTPDPTAAPYLTSQHSAAPVDCTLCMRGLIRSICAMLALRRRLVMQVRSESGALRELRPNTCHALRLSFAQMPSDVPPTARLRKFGVLSCLHAFLLPACSSVRPGTGRKRALADTSRRRLCMKDTVERYPWSGETS